MTNYEAVLGPPGTGKTSYLVEQARRAIKDEEIPRERIGFITYTRKAAEEGRSRFGGGRRSMRWVGTIHSVVLKCLNLDWGSLGILGVGGKSKLFHRALLERLEHSFEGEKGRAVRDMYSLCRHSMMTHDEIVAKVLAPRLPLCTEKELDLFGLHYGELKEQFGLIDFDDMLDRFLDGEGEVPELDVLLVDEAQDLTAKLWRVVERLAERAGRICLAGDEDQMLYKWAGADDGEFQRYFQGATVLEQSYRCSKAVAKKANAVIGPVQKLAKAWLPTDEEGEIFWTSKWYDAPLGQDGKRWFVLCPTNRQVFTLARELKERRIYYSTVKHGVSERGYSAPMTRLLRWWKAQPFVSERDDKWALEALNLKELRAVPTKLPDLLDLAYRQSSVMTLEDMEYARQLDYFGDDVLQEPKVTVLTINQAKGLEADCVLINLHKPRAAKEEWQHDYSAATRAAYVAVTRAREQVWFLEQGDSLDCYHWGE